MSKLRAVAALAAVSSAVPAWPQFAARGLPTRSATGRSPWTAPIRIDRSARSWTELFGARGSGDAMPSLAVIVNAGRKAWSVIFENRPVVDVRAEYASALPKGATRWDRMSLDPPRGNIRADGQEPVRRRVIRVRYQVLRSHGGRYAGRAVTSRRSASSRCWSRPPGATASRSTPGPGRRVVNVGTVADRRGDDGARFGRGDAAEGLVGPALCTFSGTDFLDMGEP